MIWENWKRTIFVLILNLWQVSRIYQTWYNERKGRKRSSLVARNNSHPLIEVFNPLRPKKRYKPVFTRLSFRHVLRSLFFCPVTHARTTVATSRAGRRNANSELFADRSLSMSALEVLFLSVNYPRTPRTDTPRICIPTVKLEIIPLHAGSYSRCLSLAS